ncbi:Uncharacterized protein TCAP_00436 [Tolypocladium capitatum]|uniref:Zn(2)-C6 fungal-type domain-containing protein n=1 Tax=Tolypocladium capitatum TaxID=45235 RepID=A0A2K3QQ53_9HYPO|nr:Uncharacterized protein TCAP_00436 [Tolypocladium capitatum]
MSDNHAQKRSDGRPRGKPRGMRRDRDCRRCKSRNIKCDLNRPRCLPCVQAGLPCGGYPQRLVWAGQGAARAAGKLPQGGTSRDEAAPARATVAPVDRGDELTGPSRISATTDDQNSFVDRLAAFCRQITVNGRSHSTDHYLSSEAMSLVSHLSDFIQARIESRPAADACSGDIGDEAESVDAARHRSLALGGLNEALREANPFALLAIAVFAFFEVVYDSAFGEWQRHLYGARSLLDCHCRSRAELEVLSESVTGLTEIVARLVWFDTLGAIARQTTGLIFDGWHRGILNDKFFQLVGCPQDTFDLFIYVANMDGPSDPVGSCILAMDQLLRLDATDSTDWGLSTNAHRCAAAIAVLGRVGEETAMCGQSAMASAVEKTCQIIAATPSSLRFYIHMAVPAYLAGMNATTPRQCHVVRRYWQCCNIARVPRYPGGLAKCEEEWRAKGLVQ